MTTPTIKISLPVQPPKDANLISYINHRPTFEMEGSIWSTTSPTVPGALMVINGVKYLTSPHILEEIGGQWFAAYMLSEVEE